MKTSSQRRVALAFLAHPDDAEILCAGTLIRLRDEHDFELHIATCTPGDCGSVTLPAEAIAAIRREEGRRAAEQIGGAYHCLELRDVTVAYTPETVRRAIDLFRRVNPTLVFTHPRHDYMLDHEECHKLVRMASFAFAIPNASGLPMPEHATIPHLYYADPIEGNDPYTGEPVTPTTLVDVSAVIERKAQMLACHASQRDWLRSHHGMDEYLDAMRRHGAVRGRQIGAAFAEAFVRHRGHAYPATDLLSELFY